MDLTFENNSYKRITDAVTGETVNLSQIKSTTKGGRWLRAEK